MNTYDKAASLKESKSMGSTQAVFDDTRIPTYQGHVKYLINLANLFFTQDFLQESINIISACFVE